MTPKRVHGRPSSRNRADQILDDWDASASRYAPELVDLREVARILAPAATRCTRRPEPLPVEAVGLEDVASTPGRSGAMAEVMMGVGWTRERSESKFGATARRLFEDLRHERTADGEQKADGRDGLSVDTQ